MITITTITAIIVSILIGLGIFLLLRWFWLWYWKIDKIVELLLDMREEVIEINARMKLKE